MGQPQATSGWTPVDEAPPSGWTPVDEGASAAQPPMATASIGARPQPSSLAGKVSQWTGDFTNDLKYGTENTAPGRLLHKMGAPGLYSGVSEGVGDFMGSAPLGATKMVQGGAELAQPGQRWQGAKDVASGALQASTMPGAFVAPEAGEVAADTMGATARAAFPSVKRAGEGFKAVKAAAGDIQIDTSEVGNAALETQRLAQSGGQLPKVVGDFIKRATAPGKPPITYSEARDFYSNATRLSADEFNKLTPVMKRQLGDFTAKLGKSIGDAAGQVGQRQTLTDSMKEYSRAMGQQKFKDKVIKYGKGAALGYVGGKALKDLIQ